MSGPVPTHDVSPKEVEGLMRAEPKEMAMDHKTEAQLLTAMASATSQAEQERLAAELSALREGRAAQARAHDEAMWAEATLKEAPVTPHRAPYSRSTMDTDWLGSYEAAKVDTGEAESKMRAEASTWYSHLHPGVKEHPDEVLIQAAGLSEVLASQYGAASARAEVAFLEQVRHHAATEGMPIPDPASIRPEPYEHGQYDGSTETSASDTPSLAEGEEPADDAPPSQGTNQSQNLDASTWPSQDDATWNNGDEPPGKEAAKKTGSVSLKNVGIDGPGVGIGTDPSGKRVKFRLSAEDEKSLKAILYSDMAINFSGVDIEESDVIKEGEATASRKTAASFDHDAAPEWETATAHDMCETCGWPVSKKGDGWVHDAKNPQEWTDKRKSASRKTARRRKVAAQFGSFGELEAHVKALMAKHPDLVAAAEAAYERQDQAWFDAQSTEDLKIMWEIAGSSFFVGWDDEVYDALAGRPNNGFTASRKTAGWTYLQSGEPVIDGPVKGYYDQRPIDADGNFLAGVATCGSCGRSWDAEGYPTPAGLCPFCNGDDRAAAPYEVIATASRKTTSALSDADKAKVIPPMGYEVTRADVEAAMALPSGSRPRIYAYWDNGTGNPQVVKITSQHYLDKYGPDVEFYWGTNASMDNIGEWMVSRASRKTASQTCATCGDKIAKDPSSEDPSTWHHDNGESHDHEAKPASKEARRKHASGKPIKAIHLTQHKQAREITVSGLADKQAAVEGLIEPITLSDGSTMYVNEEYGYLPNSEVNWAACDIAGLGGRQEFMFRNPIKGPVLIVGPLDEEGNDTDVTDAARRWVQRVGREAGVTFASRKTASKAKCSRCDKDATWRVAEFGTTNADPAPVRERAGTVYFCDEHHTKGMGGTHTSDGFEATASRLSTTWAFLASRIKVGDQDKPALKALATLDSVEDDFEGISGRRVVEHLLTVGQMDDGTRRALKVALEGKAANLLGIYEKVVFEQGNLRVVDMSDTPSAKNFRVEEDWGGGEWGSVAYPDSLDEAKSYVQSHTASRKQAAVGDQCWGCGGKGWVRTPMGPDWDDPYHERMMEVTCSTCGGSGVVNEPTDYPLADDPIFTDRY